MTVTRTTTAAVAAQGGPAGQVDPPTPRRRSARLAAASRRGRDAVGAVLVVAALAGLWEGYKAVGRAVGDVVPGTRIAFPVATDDLSMPHVWTILGALVEPARRGDATTLGVYLLGETSVTLREAFYGLVAGASLGLLLAVLFLNVVPLSKGLMPWLVASQTVPLVAIAPMIVIWGGKAGAPPWVAVTGIAAYLAFFPVTINTLRGLKSPPKVQLEFMRSVGAGRWQVLGWLRMPAALPFVFAGLRLAATASVVGAIVGELSAGTGRGIGRAILTFAYYYSNGPEKLYAAVLVAAAAGIVFVQSLALIERVALRNRQTR
ncbi:MULTISPECIES: ABC transporter permease [unclassified Micromonospora]|uniref:ABC transporter permease n=1 Tax=unclassified Micromonospora TaxID=2617518 RepID=UPI0010347BCF|nr:MULTISPECIES: ABC transporter permease subunit [unclassified Micromonospora]QKW13920.1 ABC transporter permease subunit [Verrucosispora sp. NA02020]TBL36413.1 ABC transporter permease subunit [Verrucosispora sp. SN26_14.1]